MKDRPPPTRTLGPISAAFINELQNQGKTIFSLNEACAISDRTRTDLTKFLSDLVKRGVLAKIKSGVYLILQMGQENTQLSNWPIIARVLLGEKNYFISYYSAMRLHGMTTHPLIDVYITTPNRIKTKKVHNISYHFIYSKIEHFWGGSSSWATKQSQVEVSDIERTILDGLHRPNLCGGIKEVVRGIWSKQREINWKKLVQYATKFHTKAAIKRLGFILELLNLGKECIPKLKKIIASAKDYILLDPNGQKKGKHSSAWRMQVNMNLDELKASIWE